MNSPKITSPNTWALSLILINKIPSTLKTRYTFKLSEKSLKNWSLCLSKQQNESTNADNRNSFLMVYFVNLFSFLKLMESWLAQDFPVTSQNWCQW